MGRQAPGVLELRPAEDPEHDLGVADVGGEQHGSASAPSLTAPSRNDGPSSPTGSLRRQPAGCRSAGPTGTSAGRPGRERTRPDSDRADPLERAIVDHGRVVEPGERRGADLAGHRRPRGRPRRARPLRASAAASLSARNRHPACSRSSGERRALREDIARPSRSRTVGHPTTSTGSRSRPDHPADQEELLRVLLAEVRRARTGDIEEAMHDGEHALEVAGPRRPFERRSPPGPGRARGPRLRADTPRRRPGAHTTSTPSSSQIARSRASSRGYRSRSAGSANWRGFTKIDTTTVGRSRRARRISETCPSCSAPIVGTSPTSSPAAASGVGATARSAAAAADHVHAREHLLDAARPSGERRPLRTARSSGHAGHLDVGVDGPRGTGRERLEVARDRRRVAANRRTRRAPRRAESGDVRDGRVAAAAASAASGSGTPAAASNSSADAGRRDEVVRREDRGRVVDRPVLVGEPEGRRRRGPPRAARRRRSPRRRRPHRDRAPGDAVDRGLDVGEGLERDAGPEASRTAVAAGVEGGERRGAREVGDPRPVGDRARVRERPRDRLDQVVGDTDHEHELAAPSGIGRAEHRHPGQVPRGARDGGLAARDRDDAVPGALPEHARRPCPPGPPDDRISIRRVSQLGAIARRRSGQPQRRAAGRTPPAAPGRAGRRGRGVPSGKTGSGSSSSSGNSTNARSQHPRMGHREIGLVDRAPRRTAGCRCRSCEGPTATSRLGRARIPRGDRRPTGRADRGRPRLAPPRSGSRAARGRRRDRSPRPGSRRSSAMPRIGAQQVDRSLQRGETVAQVRTETERHGLAHEPAPGPAVTAAATPSTCRASAA